VHWGHALPTSKTISPHDRDIIRGYQETGDGVLWFVRRPSAGLTKLGFESAFGGTADLDRRPALIAFDANDPKPTSNGSKSRSAAISWASCALWIWAAAPERIASTANNSGRAPLRQVDKLFYETSRAGSYSSM
jgi:hypothetical protein